MLKQQIPIPNQLDSKHIGKDGHLFQTLDWTLIESQIFRVWSTGNFLVYQGVKLTNKNPIKTQVVDGREFAMTLHSVANSLMNLALHVFQEL